ncbi:hypothetical protein EVAR_25312_1 [Eumeta japonica]|uniref:Uncharacterized protein n=1 Tax=Eumeta variegata TaxID=151549 RepID=A0A4C1VQJ0_EUMVA|nr:hypothetical protein EVAR_25312_1 [Eumeta japonica]
MTNRQGVADHCSSNINMNYVTFGDLNCTPLGLHSTSIVIECRMLFSFSLLDFENAAALKKSLALLCRAECHKHGVRNDTHAQFTHSVLVTLMQRIPTEID